MTPLVPLTHGYAAAIQLQYGGKAADLSLAVDYAAGGTLTIGLKSLGCPGEQHSEQFWIALGEPQQHARRARGLAAAVPPISQNARRNADQRRSGRQAVVVPPIAARRPDVQEN
jgi:hypothetical protein